MILVANVFHIFLLLTLSSLKNLWSFMLHSECLLLFFYFDLLLLNSKLLTTLDLLLFIDYYNVLLFPYNFISHFFFSFFIRFFHDINALSHSFQLDSSSLLYILSLWFYLYKAGLMMGTHLLYHEFACLIGPGQQSFPYCQHVF
jgi:hypothetical protein